MTIYLFCFTYGDNILLFLSFPPGNKSLVSDFFQPKKVILTEIRKSNFGTHSYLKACTLIEAYVLTRLIKVGIWTRTLDFGTYHIFTKSPLNADSDKSSRARDQMFGLSFPLLPYFMGQSRGGTGGPDPPP